MRSRANLAHPGREGFKPQRRRPSQRRVSSHDRDLLILDFLEQLDCPRALTSWLLYKHGQHAELVRLECDPLQYESAARFRAAYAATKFLSKTSGLKTGIDLKGVAIQSAEEAEQKCRLTNSTISAIRDGHASDLHGPVIFRAMQIVSNILGEIPSHDAISGEPLEFVDTGWSTGRTTSAYGESVTGYHKYQSSPDVTVRARTRALRLLQGSPWWGASILQCDAPVSVLSSTLNTVGGNVLFTVPKSSKTDRVICFEPHMNIRLQLAVGSYIRGRLLRHGVNLNDQSINRRRALLASRFGKMATIDLSSASDTIARELVFELLPIDWACLLDDLRSHYTTWPDGSTRKNEKFSSMGNGFTFELESLIFFALCKAVSENVSVYGDDIVIPTESFSRVARVLRACGFTLNDRKSFSTGYFRESCGGDYFGGVDCTPVFLRKLPKTTEDVVKFHNQVRRYASVTCDRRWAALMKKWRTIYPHHLGPEGFGDGHYHVNWDEGAFQRLPTWRDGKDQRSDWIDGWRYRTRVPYLEAGDDLRYAPSLSASLGPKGTFDLLHSAMKRLVKYRDIWGLAPWNWPDILWQ